LGWENRTKLPPPAACFQSTQGEQRKRSKANGFEGASHYLSVNNWERGGHQRYGGGTLNRGRRRRCGRGKVRGGKGREDKCRYNTWLTGVGGWGASRRDTVWVENPSISARVNVEIN